MRHFCIGLILLASGLWVGEAQADAQKLRIISWAD